MWGVKSNETAREQQLSVCGNGVGGGEVAERRGLSQDTSVLVKADARPERERAALIATTSPKWLPVKAPEKETVVSQPYSLSVNHCCHPSLVDWCELMPDPSGRLDSYKPDWAEPGSRAELWVSEAPGLLEQDLKGQNCMRNVTPNLIRFWTVYLFPHVFIPRSLSLFDWVGGLGLDYPRRWCEPESVCLHTGTCTWPGRSWPSNSPFNPFGWENEVFRWNGCRNTRS